VIRVHHAGPGVTEYGTHRISLPRSVRETAGALHGGPPRLPGHPKLLRPRGTSRDASPHGLGLR
jgi:hypothetical protein